MSKEHIIEYYTQVGFTLRNSYLLIDEKLGKSLELISQIDNAPLGAPRFDYTLPTHIFIELCENVIHLWFNYYDYDIKNKMVRHGMSNQSIGYEIDYTDDIISEINMKLLQHFDKIRTMIRVVSLSKILE